MWRPALATCSWAWLRALNLELVAWAMAPKCKKDRDRVRNLTASLYPVVHNHRPRKRSAARRGVPRQSLLFSTARINGQRLRESLALLTSLRRT